jgi:hypothetical protein
MPDTRTLVASMRFRPILAPLAFVLLVGAGCAHTSAAPSAAPIDDHAIARAVVLCETTEAELRRQLGTPTRDGLLRGARVVSWITGEDPVVRYLAVLLDEQAVVVDLYWDLPTEVPWVPTNRCE